MSHYTMVLVFLPIILEILLRFYLEKVTDIRQVLLQIEIGDFHLELTTIYVV